MEWVERAIERLKVKAKEQKGYLLLNGLREGVVMLACVATKTGWRPVGPNAVATYAFCCTQGQLRNSSCLIV